MQLRSVLITAVAFVLATSAQAQLIVGSDITNATIFHIDINTSAATPLLSGADARAWGMAYDKSTNTLYWNNGSVLFSSPYSLGGLTPTNLGTMTYNASTVNFVALAFRNGKLLGTRNIATEAVYEIDPVTRVATLIYQYPSTYDFGGIDVDASTDRLFGLSDTAPAGGVRGLFEINTSAPSLTFLAPYPGAETDIDGLAAHNGRAYYVTDQPGQFYVYDIATGNQAGTIPSPFTGSATFSAATYVPDEPVSIEKRTWGQIKDFYR
jgi:hypothetical protein